MCQPFDCLIFKILPTNLYPRIYSVPASRKRKHLDSQEKSNSISDKVQDVAKKPVDAEKWKKIRSIFINLSSGISFVAVFGAALAYIWYRRTA